MNTILFKRPRLPLGSFQLLDYHQLSWESLPQHHAERIYLTLLFPEIVRSSHALRKPVSLPDGEPLIWTL